MLPTKRCIRHACVNNVPGWQYIYIKKKLHESSDIVLSRTPDHQNYFQGHTSYAGVVYSPLSSVLYLQHNCLATCPNSDCSTSLLLCTQQKSSEEASAGLPLSGTTADSTKQALTSAAVFGKDLTPLRFNVYPCANSDVETSGVVSIELNGQKTWGFRGKANGKQWRYVGRRIRRARNVRAVFPPSLPFDNYSRRAHGHRVVFNNPHQLWPSSTLTIGHSRVEKRQLRLREQKTPVLAHQRSEGPARSMRGIQER